MSTATQEMYEIPPEILNDPEFGVPIPDEPEPATAKIANQEAKIGYHIVKQLSEMPDSLSQGACRTAGPEIFFPDADNTVQKAAAKKICRHCPATEDCLDWAVKNNERWGIWGGMTTVERKAYARLHNLSVDDRKKTRKRVG